MKKGKLERVYLIATREEETVSDEAMREVKKTGTSARVVKKQPSSEGQPRKRSRVEAKPSSRYQPSKKLKSELDEALKPRKIQGNNTIVPPITLSLIVNTIVKEGNLKYVY